MKNTITTALAIGGLTFAIQAENESEKNTSLESRNQQNVETQKRALEENQEGLSEEQPDQQLEKRLVTGMVDTEKLLSTGVYNSQEEEIGNLDRLLVSPKTGNVTHAVVSVGGFLGIGDRLVAIPWDQFEVKQVWDPSDKPDYRSYEKDTERELSETGEATEKSDRIAKEREAAEPEAVEVENDSELNQIDDERNTEDAEIAETEKEEMQPQDYAEIRLYIDVDRKRLESAPEFDSEPLIFQETASSITKANQFWKTTIRTAAADSVRPIEN